MMEKKQLFIFCNRQAMAVILLEKLKIIKIDEVYGGDHPITKRIMCQIIEVQTPLWLFWKIQKFLDLIIDKKGKQRMSELERIGYLRKK